jgi:outer membrane lipoprotein-sorting protein
MNRRSLLAAPLLLATPAGAQTRAPPAGAALSERDRADLARIEAYLNALTTLRARFLQIAHNGASAEGTAWIARPAGCASNTTRPSRRCCS